MLGFGTACAIGDGHLLFSTQVAYHENSFHGKNPLVFSAEVAKLRPIGCRFWVDFWMENMSDNLGQKRAIFTKILLVQY